MAENSSSAGQISLDLVIKSRIKEQLDKMRSSIQKPAEEIGQAMEDAISKPLKDMAQIVEKTLSEAAGNAADKVENAVGKAFDGAKKRAEKAVADIKDTIDDSGIDDAIGKWINENKKQSENTVDLPNRVTEVRNPKDFGFDESAMKYLDEYEKKIDELAEKAEEPVKKLTEGLREKLGNFEVPSDPIERLSQEIENSYEKVGLLQKKWQELSAAEPSDKITSQLRNVESQIISTTKHIEGLEKKLLNESENSGNALVKKVAQAASSVAANFGKAASYAGSALKNTLGGAFNTVKAISTRTLNFMKNGFSKLTNPIKKLGKTIKSAFKSVFIAAGLYAAFRALKDGLSQAANADKEFSKSLNEVKANLSIAFTPILQSIMPALNSFMSGLASVTKSVAGFISGLFGTTYKQAAEAAKKLKSTSDAAQKAKLSMAGIDEMNVLSSDSQSSSGTDGVDYSSLDMSEPELPDWAERLKTAIKSGDWAGVGAILAERINSAFSSINWKNIQDKVNGAIKGITDGISGFLDAIDWELMGDTFAGGINTVFGALYTFFSGINWSKLGKELSKGFNQAVKKTDWKLIGKTLGKYVQSLIDTIYGFITGADWGALGKAFGDSVNSLFESIDFAKAGATLSEAIKGLLDFLIEFVQTVDWVQIGSKISEFISNIDWSGIISRAFELLGSAIGATVSLLWGAIGDAVNSIRDYFSKKIESCGGNVVKGLWKGIKDAFKTVGKWIKENIFKPFIDGFKKCFGIHSPSTVMAEMGSYIIEGLCNAVSDGIKKVKEIFEKVLDTIKKIFNNIGSWFKERFSEAWENIKSVFSGIGDWFSKRWNDIVSVFTGVGSWFGEKFSEAWENIKSAFSDIKSWFTCRWSDIQAIFASVGTWFSDKFRSAYNGITGIFSKLSGFFSGIWEDISNGAKNGVNWIIDKINGLLGKVESAVNSIVDTLNKINFSIPNWVPGIGGNSFGINLSRVSIPTVPRLASGGLAYAPQLAMVGDNKNARNDPEVIAPLSKLSGMLGDNSEIVELLKIIVELLRNGMSIEIINYLFKGSREFSREVVKAFAEENARRGR